MSATGKFLVAVAILAGVVGYGLWLAGSRRSVCETSLVINAPPETVFKWITEPELQKQWVSGLTEFHPIDDDISARDSRSRVIFDIDGQEIEFENRVLRNSLDEEEAEPSFFGEPTAARQSEDNLNEQQPEGMSRFADEALRATEQRIEEGQDFAMPPDPFPDSQVLFFSVKSRNSRQVRVSVFTIDSKDNERSYVTYRIRSNNLGIGKLMSVFRSEDLQEKIENDARKLKELIEQKNGNDSGPIRSSSEDAALMPENLRMASPEPAVGG